MKDAIIYWRHALLGALIGAFLLFPFIHIIMTALAVVAEAIQ